jgi:hypothetical protein
LFRADLFRSERVKELRGKAWSALGLSGANLDLDLDLDLVLTPVLGLMSCRRRRAILEGTSVMLFGRM